MEPTGLKRRLAAIVAADVAGYTRLMEADEAGTHDAYKTHIDELFRPGATRHHGRIVKSTGDGFVAQFESVVDAVQFAVTVQREMARRNADVPDDRCINFRIGINLGDVIVEDDDIFGDGVNVAARLEALAIPGAICVSGGVFDQVRNKVDIGFENLGPQRVKNIAEPVRAYRVIEQPGAETSIATRWRQLGRRPAFSAAVAVLIIASATAGWQLYPTIVGLIGGDPMESRLIPPPDKASIAVLAFTNMGNDAGQDYFADGISEDIITDLSKLTGLFVIARNSSFSYKGKSVKVQRISRELGVRYVLEGSVRRSADTVRINVQLIDASTGGHLWAERYDRQIGDVLRVQDEISRRVVTALAIKLTARETAELAAADTDNIAAYDAFLQGWSYFRRRTPEDFVKAVANFKMAVMLAPDYGRAYAALAATYLNARTHIWFAVLGLSSRRETMALVRANLDKSKRNPSALMHRVGAQIAYLDRRFDDAVTEAERAIALDPNDAESYARLGMTLVWSGRAANGAAALRRAMRLDPYYPPGYLSRLGVAEFAAGRFAEAARLLERAYKRNPKNFVPLTHLVAAYGHLGRKREADMTLAALNRLRRAAGLDPYSKRLARRLLPYRNAADLERVIAGLERAGVP